MYVHLISSRISKPSLLNYHINMMDNKFCVPSMENKQANKYFFNSDQQKQHFVIINNWFSYLVLLCPIKAAKFYPWVPSHRMPRRNLLSFLLIQLLLLQMATLFEANRDAKREKPTICFPRNTKLLFSCLQTLQTEN